MGSVSRKTKNPIFLHFIKIRKITKGGTLGIKKIQSAPIWTKLAGLVGTIKKTSWEVILKCSCTLLRPERSKKKAATTDISQLQPPWRHGRPCLATYLHGGMAAQARTSPSSNLQPRLQSALTTWLYIVIWLLLDRLSHLIPEGPKTGRGPKNGLTVGRNGKSEAKASAPKHREK